MGFHSIQELHPPALSKPVKLPLLLFPSPDNLVESSNVFEMVAASEQAVKARALRKWNTAMSRGLAFGPAVGGIPWFLLTAKWAQLKVRHAGGGGHADEAFCFWPNATPLDGVVCRPRLRTGRRGGTPRLRPPRPHPFTHR